MKIKCIAIDDEPLALEQIKSYIEKTPFLELVGMYQSAFEAMDIIEKMEIQLLFVDINMPDINGVDFVKSIKNRPQIIFTTAYSEFAIEGFKVDAIDYLLKPISYADFLKAAFKVKNWFELSEENFKNTNPIKSEEIYVKSDYKLIRIFVDDIKYIESANEYIKIVLNNNEIITTLIRLKNIEQQLNPDKFMRIHRSFIINLNQIKAVDKSRVKLDAKLSIPIGVQYKNTFQKYIDRVIGG